MWLDRCECKGHTPPCISHISPTVPQLYRVGRKEHHREYVHLGEKSKLNVVIIHEHCHHKISHHQSHSSTQAPNKIPEQQHTYPTLNLENHLLHLHLIKQIVALHSLLQGHDLIRHEPNNPFTISPLFPGHTKQNGVDGEGKGEKRKERT